MPTMHDVDPRQLAALVAVVDHGTFARAAEHVGFTQSAISQQIAALERSAGLSVFDRPKGPKPVELTPTGRLLLDYARTALDRASDMDRQLDRLRRGISGQLTVGTFQSVSSKLLPRIIGTMRAELPEVEIRLIETDDQEVLVRGILADEVDLAFTIDVEPDDRMSLEVLGVDPMVVVAPVGEVEGFEGPLAAEALNDRPLIGHPLENSCQWLLDGRMEALGLRLNYAYRLSDNAAIQSMVRSGMGWAIMPALAVDAGDPTIAVLEVDPPIQPRTIQLLRRAAHTLAPAAETFIRISHEVTDTVLSKSVVPTMASLGSGT